MLCAKEFFPVSEIYKCTHLILMYFILIFPCFCNIKTYKFNNLQVSFGDQIVGEKETKVSPRLPGFLATKCLPWF